MTPSGSDPGIAVLISGRGSNLQALIDADRLRQLGGSIALVVSNRPDAPGLTKAQDAGIPIRVVNHTDYAERAAFERALVDVLRAADVSLVCLAGFMRLLGPTFLDAFPNAVLNIHPSLLPAFPGTNGAQQAWTYGVKVAGATVHLVTAELDGGPIVRQAAVPVHDDDTPETLAARILIEEHRIYADAVRDVLSGAWTIDGRRFVRRR
ncbi:MAG TPA: phosphoribosylglycinamide formyltransferase [Vicinamibacterales bacterium]|jgi:phosphoribosylglycinamide formyltransferase-1|nr:phosphoribosylglycinamide formyltransferase [Vicinamibacterales bacterium]